VCPAVGQAPEVGAPPPCDDEFARFLVDQQVTESRGIEQTDKRIRVLIRAADFVWKYDEPQARGYFSEAFKFAAARFSEKGFEKVENKGLTTILPDYRFEVIKAIAEKDAAWARSLIEQVLKEYEKEAAERKDMDKTRELQYIIRIAEESVKTNPELSRALLRRVMAHPLDYHWYFLPFSIAAQNREFADAIYVELLVHYRNASPRTMLFLSAYPFAATRIVGPDKYGFGTTVPPSLTPNRRLQRQFLEIFLRRAISYANDPQNLNVPAEQYRLPEPAYLIGALAELEPIVLQEFPDLFPQISEAKARVNGMLTEQARKDLSDKERRNDALGSSFEQRLKLIEEADSAGKLNDGMIIGLLTWGEKSKTEEQFRLLEPWLDKIKEDSARSASFHYFWFMRAQLAVREQRFDEAERYARKIPEVEHRAILFFEIAEAQLKTISDAAAAYQTLREVGRLAEQSPTSVEKARVLLGLVNQYIKFNQVFAVQELSDAVKAINQIETGDILRNSVIRRISSKDYSFFTSYSMPGYNLENTFKAISKDNFELSLTNAKALSDKYLQALAVMAIAQNCAENARKTPPRKKAAPVKQN
jgi:hypothetical protein